MQTPPHPHPLPWLSKHFCTIISRRSRETSGLWFTASWERCTKPHAQPSATHHISGCLIHFCRGNERQAACAAGWGALLLSWRELSNAIKIRAGAPRSRPTGGSVSKQAPPSRSALFPPIKAGGPRRMGGPRKCASGQSVWLPCPSHLNV